MGPKPGDNRAEAANHIQAWSDPTPRVSMLSSGKVGAVFSFNY